MARMSFVALFALALSGVASAAPALGDLRARAFQTFTPCVPIPGFYPVQINTVVTSGPPVSGQNLEVTVSGYTQNEIVANSVAKITVNEYVVDPLWSTTVNLCGTTSDPCSIPPGYFTFSYSARIPTELPPNEVTITTQGTSASGFGQSLFCFNFVPQ